MAKVVTADIQELTWFFESAPPVSVTGHLVAQSYEPRGGGYDPYTDNTLTSLVAAAVARSGSEWTRVKRVLDVLVDQPNGRDRFDVLRRAFGATSRSSEFLWPEVARITPAALTRGRELALEQERHRFLECAYFDARTSGCSPIHVAMRVFETDRRVNAHGLRVGDDAVRWASARALQYALEPRDVSFLMTVKKEMASLVHDAIDAYRTARSTMGATRRAAKARRETERQTLLRDMLGRKQKKESDRFWARIARDAAEERGTRATA